MTNQVSDNDRWIVTGSIVLSGIGAYCMSGSKVLATITGLATGSLMTIPFIRRAEYEARLENEPNRARHTELAKTIEDIKDKTAFLDNEILKGVTEGRDVLKESWLIEYAEKGELSMPKELNRKELPLEQMGAVLLLTHYGAAKKEPRALISAFLFTLNIRRILDRDFSEIKNGTSFALMPTSRGFTVCNLKELEKRKITKAAKEDVYNKAIVALTKNGFDVRKESWFNDFIQGKMDWQKIAVSSKTVGANTALNLLKLYQSDV